MSIACSFLLTSIKSVSVLTFATFPCQCMQSDRAVSLVCSDTGFVVFGPTGGMDVSVYVLPCVCRGLEMR
jgi:hypothetical protein